MKKILISALILIALTAQLTGCSENTSIEQLNDDSSTASGTDEPHEDISSTAPELSDASEPQSDTASDTSETQTETSFESNSQTESIPAEEPYNDNTPKWIETAVSGELYVNTDYVSSRVSAIQGSDKVKQYRLNDKVTVVASTSTNYFKLIDGTFIHCDYLSESEVKDSSNSVDYTSQTKNGYTIERINGITYVDGIMMASKTYTLPKSYDPGIRKVAADALAEMQAAAAADGLSLYVVSGYRSYYVQESVYADWVNRDGTEKADTYSSRPGHSDHQTGYTFDLNSLEQSFAYTPEGKWLAEHCADYGFIIRYPEGKEAYTGYIYEPWHVRYIGKEKAKAITESGLSLEEYYGITSDYADCEEELY